MRHRVDLTIRAPIERVFSIVADPSLLPRWRPAVAEVAEVSGPMDRVGTTFVTRYRGRLPDSRGTVVACDPPRSQVLEGRGAAAYRAALTLAPHEEGTALTFELDARMPGGLLGRALERAFVGRKVARETDADFQRLKALAETPAA